MKVKRWEAKAVEGRPTQAGYSFWCQGCQSRHSLPTENGDPQRTWSFNGDLERPVFTPSVRCWHPVLDDDDKPTGAQVTTCHSFVGCSGAKPGEIIFLSDCAHELRGAHPLLDIPGI